MQLRAALGAHARLVVVRASNTRLQLAVVRISNATLGVLGLDSVSGNVDIAATPLRNARWNIQSLGGDVDLRNLELDQVAITADTFSGVIELGSGRTQRGTAAAADRRPGQLRLNPRSAHARIVFESFSGDIRIHRQPEGTTQKKTAPLPGPFEGANEW